MTLEAAYLVTFALSGAFTGLVAWSMAAAIAETRTIRVEPFRWIARACAGLGWLFASFAGVYRDRDPDPLAEQLRAEYEQSAGPALLPAISTNRCDGCGWATGHDLRCPVRWPLLAETRERLRS